jgi:phosphatidylserine/phosphatidylglycerophosphate/cardiolipin synthase-like enzyme
MKKPTLTLALTLLLPLLWTCNPLPGNPPKAPSPGYDDGIFTLSFDPATSEKAVVDLLNDAEESIDIALYGFDNDNICSALIKAANRPNRSGTVSVNSHGNRVRTIKVRCVTEYDSEHEGSWDRLIQELRDNPYVDISIHLRTQSGIMHNKYFIVDKKYLITGFRTNLPAACRSISTT